MKPEIKYIVVDSDERPMTFDGQQLCYVSTDKRNKFYLQTYTQKEAEKYILKSKHFAHRNHLKPMKYFLMRLK